MRWRSSHPRSTRVHRGNTKLHDRPLAHSLQCLTTVSTAVFPAASTAQIKPTMLEGLKILFVDDDADVLLLVKTLLTNARAQVVTAISGEQALSMVGSEMPDVIVSDISMPSFDGYQFIAALRRQEIDGRRMTPAIALTAQSRPKDQLKALESGFNGHLAKPMRALNLIAAISDVVERFGRVAKA